jgi:AAA domain
MPADDDPVFRDMWAKATAEFHKGRRQHEAIRQQEPPERNWRDGIITAKDLQTKTFAPVRIILPGLIPEGVTILAGKPKIGKSWLELDIGLAVAGDRYVLGQTKPVQGDTLYLALEDNQRRLKKRLDKILQNAPAPERLELRTEWRRVDQGGLEDIKEWCKSVEKPRLIQIDTLAKIRPVGAKNEQAYAADYRAIEGLQKLAGEFQVGIVLTHHLRKAPSEDDPFDEVSGTLGLTGAADTIVVMKRHSGMVRIYVRGRDIEEAEFAAEFNKETCRWRLVGEAEEVFRSQQRQAVATALKEAARPMSVADIMAATERRDRHATEVLLHRMEKTGEVKHVSRGQWAHPRLTDGGEISETDGGEISEIGVPDTPDSAEGVDNATDSAADESHNESHSKLTGTERCEIPCEVPEPANPLFSKGSARESHNLTDLTGSERNGCDLTTVTIRAIRLPAIAASISDDIEDIIEPRWRS